jgi:hypothetical protein
MIADRAGEWEPGARVSQVVACSMVGASTETGTHLLCPSAPLSPLDPAGLKVVPWDGYLKYYNLGQAKPGGWGSHVCVINHPAAAFTRRA